MDYVLLSTGRRHRDRARGREQI